MVAFLDPPTKGTRPLKLGPGSTKQLPLVRFCLQNGDTVERVVVPVQSEIMQPVNAHIRTSRGFGFGFSKWPATTIVV